MAYSTANRPFLMGPPPIGGGFVTGSSNTGGGLWFYKSTHATTVVRAGLFTDADKLGMSVGDIVFVVDTEDTDLTVNYVSAVSTAGVATLIASGT